MLLSVVRVVGRRTHRTTFRDLPRALACILSAGAAPSAQQRSGRTARTSARGPCRSAARADMGGIRHASGEVGPTTSPIWLDKPADARAGPLCSASSRLLGCPHGGRPARGPAGGSPAPWPDRSSSPSTTTPRSPSAISRDLADRYGGDYRVIGVTSGAEALDVLARLALRDEPVALIASDQRMPRMTGTELFAASRVHAPDAKLLLLTAYADTDVAIQAINDIGLDYYLLKPWDPPTERLYPVVDDLLDDWQAAHPEQTSDLRVVGNRWSERAHEIKMFLTRNHVPYRWYDVERDEEGERLRGLADAGPEDLPLVLVPSGQTLRSPTLVDLADSLGLHTAASQPIYDVCIVGGGPAGLAAAVYAASEGLVDRGGRARGTRRAGRAERGDRELPGLPARAERCRPGPAGDRAGLAVRGGDGAGPLGDRAGGARSRPRRAARRGRRDRGAVGDRGQRGVVPAARRPGHRGARGSRHLLRRDGRRGGADRRRRGLPGRRRQLRRPGGAELRPARRPGW